MLRPAFRIVDMTEFGTLRGTIPATTIMDPACADDDPDLDVGNVVYVFEGLDVVPDDIDGIDPDPVATIEAEPNADGDYAYETILTPGDYTVAFTCEAGNDDPESEDEIVFLPESNLSLVADGEETIDF